MNIELITIGSELLAGQTLNTNAFYVGEQLSRVGLSLSRQISVPDEHDAIVAQLRESLAHASWVIVSGGLRPTNDDLTKKAIASVFGLEIVFHQEILDELKERYARARRTVTPFLETQAQLPAEAEIIPNALGSAVGFYLRSSRATLVAVPGVPREMHPMISDHIVPRIAGEAAMKTETLIWSTTSVPESRLYEILEPQMRVTPEVAVGFLPSEYGVRLKFSASGPNASDTLHTWSAAIRPVLAAAVYAERDAGLEHVLGGILKELNLKVAFAESCTGGLIAKRMTDVPGSSTYVMAGFVTYSDEAKVKLLGVNAETIAAHGAVSEEVASAMALGAADRTAADCAIAITGIAGPNGGSDEKPVGTVWVATSVNREVAAKHLQIMGDRGMIRERAAQAAMNMLRLRLLGLSL